MGSYEHHPCYALVCQAGLELQQLVTTTRHADFSSPPVLRTSVSCRAVTITSWLRVHLMGSSGHRSCCVLGCCLAMASEAASSGSCVAAPPRARVMLACTHICAARTCICQGGRLLSLQEQKPLCARHHAPCAQPSLTRPTVCTVIGAVIPTSLRPPPLALDAVTPPR